MNNVGAMALLMPVAIKMSHRLDLTPGQVLMPLALGTILGGMTTLTGTPPNLMVSSFRNDAGFGHFGMFDFAPVGVAVALVGVVFIAVVGWRLVPVRKSISGKEFRTGTYMTEVRIPQDSKAEGLTLRGFEREIEDSEAQIVGMVRNEVRMFAPHGARRIRAGDILLIDAHVDALEEALAVFDIKLEEQRVSSEDRKNTDSTSSKTEDTESDSANDKTSDTDEADSIDNDGEIVLRELAILPGSYIAGQSAGDQRLRTRYGLSLLAVSRRGQLPRARLRTLKLKSGDLLLLQGPEDAMSEFANDTGCVPLRERKLYIPDRRRAVTAAAIMLSAIGAVTLGLLPAAAAFTLGVLATMILRTVRLQDIYMTIDWPVIVMLAALIPIAGAMQSTGAADLMANFLVSIIARGNAVGALVVVLVMAMFLSDVMNNAATAAVLCPIALGTAASLNANPDSFLMAVAIGASCAFLTPIGHQNATLILGPGGFKFGDYWKLGLPLECLVVVVSIPILLIVWPL